MTARPVGALALAYFDDMPANWNPQEAEAATDLRALIAERDALKSQADALAVALEHYRQAIGNVSDRALWPLAGAAADRADAALAAHRAGGGK